MDSDDSGNPPAASLDYKSLYDGKFARVICDEGHKAKNVFTKNNVAICRLNARHVWFITATPMINKTIDLNGYLTALFRPEWRKTYDPVRPVRSYLRTPTDAPLDQQLHLLDPQLFNALSIKGNTSVANAYHALPRILGLIQLRRTMATVIPLGSGRPPVSPGATIPPYTITTVELRMSRQEQKEHSRLYHTYINRLKRSGGSSKTSLRHC